MRREHKSQGISNHTEYSMPGHPSKKKYRNRQNTTSNFTQDMGYAFRTADHSTPGSWTPRLSGPFGYHIDGQSFRRTPSDYWTQEAPPLGFLNPGYDITRGIPYQFQKHREDSECGNKLFLEQYRFPGLQKHSAKMYEPPHFETINQGLPSRKISNADKKYDMEDKPMAKASRLRGDAPEFVPSGKLPLNFDPNASVKEPCWLVVSSC